MNHYPSYQETSPAFVAEQELKAEQFRAAVEQEKSRIRAKKRSLLDRLFPWVISIRRK